MLLLCLRRGQRPLEGDTTTLRRIRVIIIGNRLLPQSRSSGRWAVGVAPGLCCFALGHR